MAGLSVDFWKRLLTFCLIAVVLVGANDESAATTTPTVHSELASVNNVNILAQQTPAMPECEPYYIAGVYTAVCMRRRLTHVPRHLMTSIQVMDASNNELVALRDGEFRPYPWLKEIYLQENRIRHIGRNAFSNLTRLHTLVLTSNDLSQLDADIFRPLSGLRVLRLSNNPLRVIRRETFKYLRHLTELRLDSCLLTKIEPGSMRPFIGTLEILSVAYNQLTIFTADLSLPSASTSLSAFSGQQQSQQMALKEIHLYGNPWHCNCQMRLLRLLLNESPDVAYNFGNDLKAPTCVSPPSLSGQIWSRVPVDRFGCEPVVTAANMPPMPQIGNNITLQCSFAADPSPTFRWFKDGIPIADVGSTVDPTASAASLPYRGRIRQKDRKLSAHNFTSRLDLIEVTHEFSGVYECIAENTAGASRSKFQLRIRTADGKYEPPANEMELSAGLLTSLVATEAAGSPTTRLVIVSVVVGAVLVLFLLTATAIYFCFCRRRSEKDSSAVAILRKIEAKRLAMNASHEASMSLRKNILSNSSSLHSHMRPSSHGMMDGEDVKLTEVYPSHLVVTSPSQESDPENPDGGHKRDSSNSTVVTNDRSTASSKSSPDNSTNGDNHHHHHHHHPHHRLGVDHLPHDQELDEALAIVTPLCYYAATNSNGSSQTSSEQEKLQQQQQQQQQCDGSTGQNKVNGGNDSGVDSTTSVQDLAMAHSAAFKTYSEYLSLTLPKMVHSPRYQQSRSSGGVNPNGNPIGNERGGGGLLQATLVRQLPILSAYGYVEQVEQAPKVSITDLSDLDLSDIDSASQVGITNEHARLAMAYRHHQLQQQQQQQQQQQSAGGRRQQRFTGDLHHSVFLPANGLTSSIKHGLNNSNSMTSSVIEVGKKANLNGHGPAVMRQSAMAAPGSATGHNNGGLVHFLGGEQTPALLAASITSSADTSV